MCRSTWISRDRISNQEKRKERSMETRIAEWWEHTLPTPRAHHMLTLSHIHPIQSHPDRYRHRSPIPSFYSRSSFLPRLTVHATLPQRQRARGLDGTEVGQPSAMHPERRLAAQWRSHLLWGPEWLSSERSHTSMPTLPSACAHPHPDPHPRAPRTTHRELQTSCFEGGIHTTTRRLCAAWMYKTLAMRRRPREDGEGQRARSPGRNPVAWRCELLRRCAREVEFRSGGRRRYRGWVRLTGRPALGVGNARHTR
ncbi:hypothetical protein DFH08DRAFT_100940 [Mycena albidolilacea]|uniref:Uncharacterized protein n=1 Tax=Mycena albidolilacea TaxID=1033008 RepID=A0AAD7EUD5_9AGAR|nr:hypothetical protein DFH08DRAFT_100940 [Mycena albidolilacea]